MNRFSFSIMTLCLVACSSSAPREGTERLLEGPPKPTSHVARLDEGGCVEWIGSKDTGSHEGGFGRCEGVMAFGEDGALASVEVTVFVESIFSDNEMLTQHLLTPDFFDAQRFATATFKSTAVRPLDGEGRYEVEGAMTLMSVTRKMRVEATVEPADEGGWRGRSEFSLLRSDHGMRYAGKPDDLIKDEVRVVVTLNATPSRE